MKQAAPNRLESVCVCVGGGYLFSFACEISKIKHNISSHLLTLFSYLFFFIYFPYLFCTVSNHIFYHKCGKSCLSSNFILSNTNVNTSTGRRGSSDSDRLLAPLSGLISQPL